MLEAAELLRIPDPKHRTEHVRDGLIPLFSARVADLFFASRPRPGSVAATKN